MKKISFIFILGIITLISFTKNSYSQLGNKNMYLLANVNTHSSAGLYSAVWGYKAPDGREYAILGCYDGTQFVDITDVSNIHQVGFVASTNPASSNNVWREMKTYSHYAYIVSEVGSSGIQIVDLQYLPDSVHYVKKFLPSGFSKAHSISQSGPYLYINGQTNSGTEKGVRVYDLSVDPETPVVRGAYNALYIHDCRVFNDTIYAANVYDGKVSIISATNKNSLSLVTSFNNLISSGPHNTAVTDDRKTLLVTDEIGATPRLMKIWNIEDLGNIYNIATWQPTGITTTIVHNVEAYGKYALVAHYEAGVRLVDISNPAAPAEVAYYDTYPSVNTMNYNGCWGVYMFPTGKITASDRSTGLYVLKTNFNISVAIEGFYNSVSNRSSRKDTVTAYLRSNVSPFNKVDSSKAVVDSVTFTGNFKFNNVLSGTYYIALKHRNSIETWSKINGETYNPMAFSTYDFTNSVTKAYGNNMTLVDSSPIKYALFSGDVNQDGTIDAGDMSLIENDVANSLTGYINSDLNGDNTADASDLAIVENNVSNSISSVLP